ncbi:MAG: archease [Candidatus Curtissbacteria bacterium]|nr:archease [Candidatus Curtissbacteria bacterium]
MKSFKVKPHVADVRLRVKADTLPELFEAALLGMNQIFKKDSKIKDNQNLLIEHIKIESNDQTSLLVDFLSQILTLSQINKAIFSYVDFKKLGEHDLEAEIQGFKIESFDEDIKAVSYHEAEISKNKKGEYQTTIIFDI